MYLFTMFHLKEMIKTHACRRSSLQRESSLSTAWQTKRRSNTHVVDSKLAPLHYWPRSSWTSALEILPSSDATNSWTLFPPDRPHVRPILAGVVPRLGSQVSLPSIGSFICRISRANDQETVTLSLLTTFRVSSVSLQWNEWVSLGFPTRWSQPVGCLRNLKQLHLLTADIDFRAASSSCPASSRRREVTSLHLEW